MSHNLVPFVIEQTDRGERSFDIYSRLLKDRLVLLNGEIYDEVASVIVAQILFLDAENQKKDIFLYINSPGGTITSGLAIYDVMQAISAPINTVCIGQAASMAAVLLCAGTAGKRYAMPHSRIMIHQPRGGSRGTMTDMKIDLEEGLKLKDKLYEIMSLHTEQSIEKIKDDCERDKWMSTQEAIEYHLIDKEIKKIRESQ